MRWCAACPAAAIVLGLGLAAPTATLAQDVGVVQADIVLIDPERLFEDTRLGQAIARRIQQERDALIARNRTLEAELEAEERALTELRDETAPEDFRDLADAFDEKVQQIRLDSERRARELERSRERAPRDFLRQVEPILVEIMRDAGAVTVLDQRSVLLSSEVVNLTDLAIRRIDERLGAGASGDGPAPQSEEQEN
ncbi:MAG: OmpH family outer membrane protein [Pseudomonadota bacterium]